MAKGDFYRAAARNDFLDPAAKNIQDIVKQIKYNRALQQFGTSFDNINQQIDKNAPYHVNASDPVYGGEDPNGMSDYFLPDAQKSFMNQNQLQDSQDLLSNFLMKSATNPDLDYQTIDLAGGLLGKKMNSLMPPEKQKPIEINGQLVDPNSYQVLGDYRDVEAPKGFEGKFYPEGMYVDSDNDGTPEFHLNKDYYDQEARLREISNRKSGGGSDKNNAVPKLSKEANEAMTNIMHIPFDLRGDEVNDEQLRSYKLGQYDRFKRDLPSNVYSALTQAEAQGNRRFNPQQMIEIFQSVPMSDEEYEAVKNWLVYYNSIYENLR